MNGHKVERKVLFNQDFSLTSQLIPIAALLIGSAFLFVSGGINGLILPVRGQAEGFSSLSLGLLGTGWALGYVLGCLKVPGLVARVGHVRSFGVMAAIASISVLLSLLLIDQIAWIVLRSFAGFAFAGAAMIVESWLNERSESGSRGMVFGVYTMINLAASTIGQQSLNLGDTNSYHFFVIAAIFYCLALLPTAISSTSAPVPLVAAKFNLKALWLNSPVSVVAVLLIGVSNSAFGTLGAVYATQTGFDLASIALFMSLPIIAGAVAQIPVGFISDRIDRRLALIAVAAVALSGDLIFILVEPDSIKASIVAICLFGGAIFSLYPIAVAHANDHAPPNEFVRTSSGLLLLFGIGSMLGPIIAGLVMSTVGPKGLFITTIAPHVLILIFTAWRMTQRGTVDDSEKTEFVTATPLKSTTQTVVLSNPNND